MMSDLSQGVKGRKMLFNVEMDKAKQRGTNVVVGDAPNWNPLVSNNVFMFSSLHDFKKEFKQANKL